MTDKEEVQLVDMVLRIRNKLAEAADQKLPLPDVISEQLTKHIETIVSRLPPDLQLVLQKETFSNGDNTSTIQIDDSERSTSQPITSKDSTITKE
jgi:hypothetical protein